MKITKNYLWMVRNSLENDDTIEEIKEYLEVYLKIKEFRITVIGLTFQRGTNLYLFFPNENEMCLEVSKKSIFWDKEDWRLKRKFYGEDVYLEAIKWIERGNDLYGSS